MRSSTGTRRIAAHWRLLALMVAVVLVAAACGDTDETTTTEVAGETTTTEASEETTTTEASEETTTTAAAACPEMVDMGWLHGFNIVASASAPVVIALDQGYYEEECLDFAMDVTTGATSIRLIAAGRWQTGSVSDAGTLINFVNDGFPLTSIGLLSQESARGFAVPAELGLETPADFEGLRLGVKGNLVWPEFLAMMECVDADFSTVEQVPVGFSSVELPEGLVDILPIFLGNEERRLREDLGMEIDVFFPHDWCFDSVGSMMLVNTDFGRENPEAVAGFVRATIRGMNFMLENKEETLDIIEEYGEPEVAEQREAQAFRYDVTISQMEPEDGCLGMQTPEQWESQIQQLADLGLLPEQPVTELLYDNTFLEMAYADLDTCELSDDPFLKDGRN